MLLRLRPRTCPHPLPRRSTSTLSPRSLFGWATKRKPAPVPDPNVLLAQDDLFHPFATSPVPALRARAQTIKSIAPCPVCLDVHGERRRVQFDCPDCGWPTHCTEEHHAEDKEHAKYCPRLRDANEDEHDLRSGRSMWEYDMPGEQGYEEAISFANWDMLWYTRGFRSVDTERSRRHLSKVLTYPMTVAGILHEYSGFTTRNQRLTKEGARSMHALRSILHSDAAKSSRENPLALQDTIRVFILGARGESSLPDVVWQQLNYCFYNVNLHIHFIGPQTALPKPKPPPGAPPPPPVDETTRSPTTQFRTPVVQSIGKFGRMEMEKYGVPSWTNPVNKHLTITGIQSPWADVWDHFGPFDPYTDVFFIFCPGFGFPSRTHPELLQIQSPAEWKPVLPQLLPTKCAIFVTGFSPTDVERDVRSLDGVEGVAGEFDWILTPGHNPFGSEKWDVADFDPRVMIRPNWGVWGIRGKQTALQPRQLDEWAIA